MLYKSFTIPDFSVSALKTKHSDLLNDLLALGVQGSDPELIADMPAVVEMRLPDLPQTDDWILIAELLNKFALAHLGLAAQGTLTSMIDHYKERFDTLKMERVKNALCRKPMTKKAIYFVWHADDIDRDVGSACLVYFWFRRKGGELQCHAHMRACDIFRKFLADILLFNSVHQRLATQLGMARGAMILCIDSAHIYVCDQSAVAEYLGAEHPPHV